MLFDMFITIIGFFAENYVKTGAELVFSLKNIYITYKMFTLQNDFFSIKTYKVGIASFIVLDNCLVFLYLLFQL